MTFEKVFLDNDTLVHFFGGLIFPYSITFFCITTVFLAISIAISQWYFEKPTKKQYLKFLTIALALSIIVSLTSSVFAFGFLSNGLDKFGYSLLFGAKYLPILLLFCLLIPIAILTDVSILKLFIGEKTNIERSLKKTMFDFLLKLASGIRQKKKRRLTRAYLLGERLKKNLYAIWSGGVTTLLTTFIVIFSVYDLQKYGSFLFVGSPFLAGLVGILIYGARYRISSFKQVFFISIVPCFFTGIALLLTAIEGLICLLMASPIAVGLSLIGGLMGYILHIIFRPFEKEKPKRKNRNKFYAVALVLPLLLLFEKQPLFVQPISTSLIINAPPSAVWPYVIAFPKLPEPTSWWFHAGIAHPKGAVIKGKGVGAVRYCNFTTGPFIEPITAWEPPHRLAFDVAKQPPSMKELSPWPNIHPPHLDGYFQSKRGEFRLIPLPNGGTKVVGTTWYVMNIWPHAYWHLWSDMLLHAIHYEVLNHIKTQVESHKSTPSPTPNTN